MYFFFSSRRRHTRFDCDWSSDVCSSDLFAVRREFHIHGKESTRLQFRSEFFNILNHPNFASPNNAFDGLTTFGIPPSPQFGQSTQMLGRSLSSPVAGAGGFTSIFQIGGPRSVQFALKLLF